MSGQRKPLDPRIPQLITNGVLSYTRSFFLIVGSSKQQHSQIVNLHYLLSQARLSNASNKAATSRPNVLWCYKKELGFTSNRKKRQGKIKRDVKRGLRDEGELDPFELFVGVTDIRYCYYKDTDKILGQTYGMLVLSDFESLTPNLLARTIETVQGGGVVVLLLQSMTSLKQLYTMSMDVHARYRTESSDDPIARFNERFILSLGSCRSSLVLDDELNVLPISAGKDVKPIEGAPANKSADAQQLKELVESLKDTLPVGGVVPETVTIDQAQALLTFTDALSSKSLSSTVTLTAARGRGKSAALGLAVALAVSYGYSNIFVTSPHPDNLGTFWQFVFKGFDRLGFKEFLDYDIVKSSNKEWNEAVVRANIFRNHRQTIQYIQPQDAQVLGQAELVVIDEAAAIPLPLVRALMGPYLVFMASTINGYEGTGRSLSLKLIQSLRELSRSSSSTTPANSALTAKDTTAKGAAGPARSLREIKLDTPIRYGQNDAIEKWLNSLLCLDSSLSMLNSNAVLAKGTPHPSTCDLYAVNRDTLFSYHAISEVFLQKLMALFVSSHYKNSPNDLQLLSDAPNHLLFVLLPPIKENAKEMTLPEPLVVLQVALEGKISKQSVLNSLQRGIKAGGDLIPWTVSQQYQDDDFATLSGARVVRIATNPDFGKMGYGSRALSLLLDHFSGKLVNLDEVQKEVGGQDFKAAAKVDKNASLSTDVSVRIRDPAKMPPLLQRLPELQPQKLDWIGVSYGLTPQLFKFWKRAGYVPLYVRQTSNDLTGEHTCVMLRGMAGETGDAAKEWLSDFASDFRKRFISLLSFKFRDFASVTALSILEGANAGELRTKRLGTLTSAEVSELFSPYDMKRLVSYGNNMLDYHVILDLLPPLATLYFTGRFEGLDCKLTGVQSSILLALGLQRKEIEDIERELRLPVSQALALFVKVIRKLTKTLEDLQKSEIEKSIPQQQSEDAAISAPNGLNGAKNRAKGANVAQQLQDELEAGGDEATSQLRQQQREIIDSLDLDQYKIANSGAEGNDETWAKIRDLSKVVSVKTGNGKRKERDEADDEKVKQDKSASPNKHDKNKKDKKHKKHAA